MRRQVRQQPDRVQVEHELHVAVALLPRGDRVAVDGVHVDVDARAGSCSPRCRGRAPRRRSTAPCSRLPCSRPCMSVNATTTVSISPVVDPGRQAARVAQVPVVRVMVVSSSSVSSQQAAQQRGRVVAVLLHRPPRPRGVAGRGSPRRCRACWRSECVDVGLEHRDRDAASRAGVACTEVTASISSRRAGDGGDRQVEPGVGLPVRGRLRGAGDRLVAPAPAARRVASYSSARGRELRGTRLDDPPELQRVQPVRRAATASGAPTAGRRGRGLSVTTVPPPRPRVVSTSPACRSAAIASRSVARETSEPLGQLALRRQRACPAGRRPAGSPSPAAPRRPRRRGGRAPGAAPPRGEGSCSRRRGGGGRRSRAPVLRRIACRCQWSEFKPFLRAAVDVPIQPGLASRQRRPSVPGGAHVRSTPADASGLTDGREAARQARVQAGPQPLVVRLLQLRHLVLDHLDPGRLLHRLRRRPRTTAARSRSRGAWPIISASSS